MRDGTRPGSGSARACCLQPLQRRARSRPPVWLRRDGPRGFTARVPAGRDKRRKPSQSASVQPQSAGGRATISASARGRGCHGRRARSFLRASVNSACLILRCCAIPATVCSLPNPATSSSHNGHHSDILFAMGVEPSRKWHALATGFLPSPPAEALPKVADLGDGGARGGSIAHRSA